MKDLSQLSKQAPAIILSPKQQTRVKGGQDEEIIIGDTTGL